MLDMTPTQPPNLPPIIRRRDRREDPPINFRALVEAQVGAPISDRQLALALAELNRLVKQDFGP